MISIDPVARPILRLGVPMMLAALVTGLSQLVVLGMLGRLGGGALYVRAAYTPLVFVFLALGEGLAASAHVACASAHGREDAAAGMRAAARLLALGFAAFALVAAAVCVAAPEFARFVGAPTWAADEFTRFTRWMSAASVLLVLPLVTAATLRGFGRAGAGAAVTGTYVAVNLAGVGLLGLGLGLGVMSLAWSAVAAALAAGALGALFIARARLGTPARTSGDGGWHEPLRLLRRIALPILGSYCALFVLGVVLIRIVQPFGTDVVTGFSVAYSLQALAVVPAIALGSAAGIHLNRLHGAGRASEARPAAAALLRVAAGLYASLAALTTALALIAPGLITGDPGAAGAAREYLLVVGPSLTGLGLILVMLTLMEQIGAGGVALALNLVYVAASCAAGAALVDRYDSPLALYGTLATTAIVGVPIVLPVGLRRVRRLGALARAA